jgi:hypothetical protein
MIDSTNLLDHLSFVRARCLGHADQTYVSIADRRLLADTASVLGRYERQLRSAAKAGRPQDSLTHPRIYAALQTGYDLLSKAERAQRACHEAPGPLPDDSDA